MALWTRLADGTSRLLNKIAPPASITAADNALHSYDPSVAALLSSGGSSTAAWLATIAGRLLNGSDSAASLLHAAAAVLGTTADASIDSDADGTIKGSLRGLAKAFLARIPAIGPQLAAASMSVYPRAGCKGMTKPIGWAISGATAASAALDPGYHWISADVDWWWRQGPQATVTVSYDKTDAAYGEKLRAGEARLIYVSEAGVDDGVAGITGASGPTGEAQAKQEETA